MKNEAAKLATLLRARDNKTLEALVIGEVVKLSPLTVSDGAEILLDDELIITFTVRQLIDSTEIKVGNKVAMLSDGQKYVVIDKVV